MAIKKGDFIEIGYIGKIKDTGFIFDLTDETLAKKNNLYNKTVIYGPIIIALEAVTKKSYQKNAPSMRRIADHIKGAVMMIAEGIMPASKEQGYILRRLIRRAMVSMQKLDLDYSNPSLIKSLVKSVADIYKSSYPNINAQKDKITSTIFAESQKFSQALKKGTKKLTSLKTSITGKVAFNLYQSYGLPLEITQELVAQLGKTIDQKKFTQEFKKHQAISRTGSDKKFKGGLADKSTNTIKLHTTTHILHQALREVLGDHVHQKGSNVTAERLRFDFSHPKALTDQEIKKIQNIINQKIKQDLPVKKTIETKDQALKSGALAFFQEKYADQVSVYTIGKHPQKDWFSKELCGGPHVSSTAKIGAVTINKQQSIGEGLRRIYAVLKNGTQ